MSENPFNNAMNNASFAVSHNVLSAQQQNAAAQISAMQSAMQNQPTFGAAMGATQANPVAKEFLLDGEPVIDSIPELTHYDAVTCPTSSHATGKTVGLDADAVDSLINIRMRDNLAAAYSKPRDDLPGFERLAGYGQSAASHAQRADAGAGVTDHYADAINYGLGVAGVPYNKLFRTDGA
jgi:hypothetical protein